MGSLRRSVRGRIKRIRWRWFERGVARVASAAVNLTAIGLSVVLLHGCQTSVTKPQSREQAAGILISSSAISWQDIASSLQPNFQISGATALQQVAPITQEAQVANLNALGVSAVIGALAGPTGDLANGAPATVPNPQAPSGIPMGATLPTAPPVNTSLGIDPMLQYRGALSLFQYVQELNADLTSSTFTENFVPYVVRLKFTVVPHRQNLPYDLLAKVSFFIPTACTKEAENLNRTKIDNTTRRTVESDRNKPEVNKCLENQPIVVPLLVTDDIQRAASTAAAESARQLAAALQIISPYAQGSVNANSVKQHYQALTGQNYDSLLTVGRDNDNTLMIRIGAAYQTVSLANKDSDKAEQNTRSLIGQNYDVSTIVLVPKAYFRTRMDPDALGLEVFAHSDLVDIQTGQPLPRRSHTVTVNAFDEALNETAPDIVASHWYKEIWQTRSEEQRFSIANHALQSVASSDYVGLLEMLCGWKDSAAESPNCLDAESVDQSEVRWMWNRLAALLPDSSYISSSIDLPYVRSIVIPVQPVSIFDDGKSGMQVQLRTQNKAIGQKLVATMLMTAQSGKDKKKSESRILTKTSNAGDIRISLLSKSSLFDQTTGILTFQFASPVASGILGVSEYGNTLEIRAADCDWKTQSSDPLVVNCTRLSKSLPRKNDEITGGDILSFDTRYILASSGSGPVPGVSIASGSKEIAESNGTGTLVLYFPKWGSEDSAMVTLDGASIVSASAGTLANGQLAVKAAGAVTLQLINVFPGVPVTATAEGKVGGASSGKTSIVLNVVPVQSSSHSQ